MLPTGQLPQRMPSPLNLFLISTSIRNAYVWVHGFERSALGSYHRAVGEIIHAVVRLKK